MKRRDRVGPRTRLHRIPGSPGPVTGEADGW